VQAGIFSRGALRAHRRLLEEAQRTGWVPCVALRRHGAVIA
jgi:hypothetical protein